jgi:hypothetical protein
MINLSQINAKLKSREKRTHQNVSRTQVECAKIAKEVGKLETQVAKLGAGVNKLKAASPKPVQTKAKPSKTSPEPEVISLVRNPAKQKTPPAAVQSESYRRIREKLEKNGTLKT